MTHPAFLRTLRELATCFQAFESYSAEHVRSTGLTPPQFDIIATLGNTPGMTCKQLGERTLITKGTLTGILGRLADKGLLERQPCPVDGRSILNSLTAEGDALFQQVFPKHLHHLQHVLDKLSPSELAELEQRLRQLRELFQQASRGDEVDKQSAFPSSTTGSPPHAHS